MIAGLNKQIRTKTLVLNNIAHLSSPIAWSKPLSVYTETMNNQFQKLGYFWCLQTSSGSKYQYTLLTSYYKFDMAGGGGILNSSSIWGYDNESDGIENGITSITSIPRAGQALTEYIDFVYPNIGGTYRTWTISDVYFPI